MKKQSIGVTEDFDVKERIRQLASERGWNDYELSLKSEISPSTISRWWSRESGVSGDSITKLCRAFNMTVSEFYSGKADPGFDDEHLEEQIDIASKLERLSARERSLVVRLIILLDSYKHNI